MKDFDSSEFDVSSDVAPDELGTADAFEVETEVDLVDVDENQ